MHKMFNSAFLFAGPANLNWNTAKVTDMSYMFETAKQFNSDIANWVRFHLFFCCCFHCFQYHSNQIFSLAVSVVLLKDTSRVGNMEKMFYDARAFKQDVSKWIVSKVTKFIYLFAGTRLFNSDISEWNTLLASSMYGMFSNSKAFNIDITKWNIPEDTELTRMFAAATGFDRTLCGDKWTAPGKRDENWDVLKKSTGRYGCCDVGSFMSNPHNDPFNSTDGGGTCLACPTGWHGTDNIPHGNYNCTQCESGKSSVPKSITCASCARGRILVTAEPLVWYVCKLLF